MVYEKTTTPPPPLRRMLKRPDADVIADALAPGNRRYFADDFRHAGARASPDTDAIAAA